MVKADVKYDYYADLELPPTANTEEIKKQFRTLAKQYHPDRNPGREVEVVAKFQAVQAAHEILSDPQTKAKYDADRAKQEKAAREVLNAFRRNANPPPTNTAFPPPSRRATTGAPRAPFNPAAGRGRPPPPPPPPAPSSGADKFAAFTRAGSQQRDRAEEEAQKAKYDAMRGFRSMRNAQPQAFPTAPLPPRPAPYPTAPRPDINTPSAGVPPRHHRSYEHFQNMPQPSFPGMSRTASSRKPAGFAPNTPGGDEPMAQRTSAYTHYHSQRRDSYFQDDDIPHSPNVARPEPVRTRLRRSSSSADLEEASRRPQRPDLDRIATGRYAQSSGEKTYVNGVGRSASVRNSPIEREWGGHDDHDLRRPHSHHESSARHHSASPNLSPTPGVKELSSSESESSTDDEPENFASRPKAKPRPRRQKAGGGAFAFRHVVADDPTLNRQPPPPNHKHPHSPQDEYTTRYEYPPPPPRSEPRVFPEPQPFQSNANPRMDDIRQHTRHVSSGDPKAHLKYGTFHFPSRTWSEDWGFSPSKHRKPGPSLNGLPSWAVPSSVFPQQTSSARKGHLESVAEEKIDEVNNSLSHSNPRFNQELFPKADCVSSTSFNGVHESSNRPYPQPGHQSVSQEDINKTFSAADWDGKFNSGDEHFRPTEGCETKSLSRTSRTRARSDGRGRRISPTKEGSHSEPIDLTSDNDAPQTSAADGHNGNGQASKLTAQPFQPAKFSAEEWAAKLKDETWALPNIDLNGSNLKTPKRPSRSTGARRPTHPTKVDSEGVKDDPSTNPPKLVSETAVPGLSGFRTTTNGSNRTSGGGAADVMDIDDSFSDAAPFPRPANEDLHSPTQAGPTNEVPPHSDVDLTTLATVAPFVPSSTGLKDMDDLSADLPFKSRAAPAVNLGKPASGSSSDLRLPKPPKRIFAPSELNKLSWARYVADMNAYVCDWQVFNKKMVEHFRSRQEQLDMNMHSHWIDMIGDGPLPSALDGRNAGYATYMAWMAEDDKCREWWNVANEKNRQCFEDLGRVRERVKADAQLLHTDGLIW